MITEFKLFEEIHNDVKVDNYIITKYRNSTVHKDLWNFLSTHIGLVTYTGLVMGDCAVYYTDIPLNIDAHFHAGSIALDNIDIKYYGTKTEMEIKMKANNFNL